MGGSYFSPHINWLRCCLPMQSRFDPWSGNKIPVASQPEDPTKAEAENYCNKLNYIEEKQRCKSYSVKELCSYGGRKKSHNVFLDLGTKMSSILKKLHFMVIVLKTILIVIQLIGQMLYPSTRSFHVNYYR